MFNNISYSTYCPEYNFSFWGSKKTTLRPWFEDVFTEIKNYLFLFFIFIIFDSCLIFSRVERRTLNVNFIKFMCFLKLEVKKIQPFLFANRNNWRSCVPNLIFYWEENVIFCIFYFYFAWLSRSNICCIDIFINRKYLVYFSSFIW